jgi:hypothetical protein
MTNAFTNDKGSLEERVNLFNQMALPGQPLGMHMGTSYLVNDLARENNRLAAEIELLREALRPFSDFGVNVDDNGWTSNIHREPISTWFGPSDFRYARAKLEGASND